MLDTFKCSWNKSSFCSASRI